MLGEGWTRDEVKRIDEIACSEGKPVPKKGDGSGRSADQRARYEGEYQRVSQSGAQPETERDAASIPNYVFQRNARRKAESAYWHGEDYEGPGAEGYGDKGGKGKGKGKDQAKRSNFWTSAGSAAWWGAASANWWEANAMPAKDASGEPGPSSFDYSFYLVIITIFACGAVLGGVIGYLMAYIKYKKTKKGAKHTVAQQTMSLPAGGEGSRILDTGAAEDIAPEELARPPPLLRGAQATETALRNRMPRKIVITKTGLEESHIYHREGCHVTRPGIASGTNITFRKCNLCFG